MRPLVPEASLRAPLPMAGAALCALLSASAIAQKPPPFVELVKEIEVTGEALLLPGPIMGTFFEIWGSSPSQLFVLGDELLFVADDRTHGAELWASDGSAEGTHLVADICDGPCSSSPLLLGSLGDELLFAAYQEATGSELWATDGSPEGTRFVAELCPGECSGFVTYGWIDSFDEHRSASLGGELYFAGYDLDHGEELWVSDGTAAGTYLLEDLCPGVCRGAPRNFVEHEGDVWLTGGHYEVEIGIWRAGASGAVRVDDPCSGSRWLGAHDPQVHQGDLYWLGRCAAETLSTSRNHLLALDGGAIVSLALLPAGENGYPGLAYSLISVGESLFFVSSPFDFHESDEIWISGGLGGDPARRLDVTFPDGGGFSGADIGPLAPVGDRVIFFAGDGDDHTLWASDGEVDGTFRLAPLRPLYGVRPEVFAIDDQRAIFAARDESDRIGLWTSDGTTERTLFVDELALGRELDDPGEVARLGGRLFFPAVAQAEEGAELWALDASRLAADPCFGPSDEALCLRDRRFEVRVTWEDSRVGSGVAHARRASEGSGFFWFFREENLELAVKVLDGTAINGHHWVGYGSLSDVGYALEVVDRWTGERAVYDNAEGEFCGAIDVRALPGPTSSPSAVEASAGNDSAPTAALASCLPDDETLCLQEGRFAVTVTWQAHQGTGSGRARAATDESGHFFFFAPDNLELLVKVLDGRVVNGHFWLFWGALSDVEYHLRVEDMQSGEIRDYLNPAGTLCGGHDLEAF